MKKKRAVVFLMCFLVCLVVVLYVTGIIPHVTYDNNYFNIETYVSNSDKDGDGVDDQTDILRSVREYIETEPEYKSVYYATGYPNDGYGVCTDVVAQGLKGAGYDIMNLLHEDVLKARGAYNIETPDKNIDFRRVPNLKVYLDRNAISLTTDIYDIDQWQGGDIVVFTNHVGVVSDRRNKEGIPYVIHHDSPYQIRYEEDFLGKRYTIAGHYRIS